MWRRAMNWGVLLLICSASACSPRNQPISVTTHDYYPGAGWDGGEFKLNYPSNNKPTDFVDIRFMGVRTERIETMVVSTAHWSLDVSDLFRNLPHPFPNRLYVKGSSIINGTLPEVYLEMPYRPAPKQCHVFSIIIRLGKALSPQTIEAEDDKCEQ